jgi:glycosyltransferase involved in cell wall biosynthesis
MGEGCHMKTVIARGPFLTHSGYGVHSRQIAKWLIQQELAGRFHVSFLLTPWGVNPWFINKDDCDGLVGEVLKRAINNIENMNFDLSFQVQLPNEWDSRLASYNIGVTAGVESDRCNPTWENCINSMNQVIVPSEHVKKTFLNTFTPKTNVTVIPESFPVEYELYFDTNNVENRTQFDFKTKFNFLVFGQLTGNVMTDRKNTFFTLKWLFDEFRDNSDVGIIIKTNLGRLTKTDKNNVVELLKRIKAECKGNNDVYLLHGDLSDKEMHDLYTDKNVKAIINATRGEGFGLPLLEAACLKLPVIATGWSGHIDFMSLGKYISLDYKLSEIPQSRVDYNIFVSGSKWAEVNEDDFRKKVRKFYQNPANPITWADNLSKKIREKYSFSSISKLYDNLMFTMGI